jgi:hypothetical protein
VELAVHHVETERRAGGLGAVIDSQQRLIGIDGALLEEVLNFQGQAVSPLHRSPFP